MLAWLCALTGYSSKVNGLFGPRRAAVFGADAVLAGCIDVELQNVVLLHHCRHTEGAASLSERYNKITTVTVCVCVCVCVFVTSTHL